MAIENFLLLFSLLLPFSWMNQGYVFVAAFIHLLCGSVGQPTLSQTFSQAFLRNEAAFFLSFFLPVVILLLHPPFLVWLLSFPPQVQLR